MAQQRASRRRDALWSRRVAPRDNLIRLIADLDPEDVGQLFATVVRNVGFKASHSVRLAPNIVRELNRDR